MADYDALDCSASCNRNHAALGLDRPFPTGSRTWRGLPFSVGGADGSVIALGEGVAMQAVTIAIGRPARWVVVAHRLLDGMGDRDRCGRHCADYVVRFADLTEQTLPIRERLEIACVDHGWGQLPILAWPDVNDGLFPRWGGDWGSAGHRQYEASQAWKANDFYLWAWRSPRPEAIIASLTVVPKGPRIAVGAVTLGQLEECPFNRNARREVRIVLPQEADARAPFRLEVEVDRGTASFVQPLPSRSAEAFLADPMKGFGEPMNPGSSPAHVGIAANPSATVTVRRGDEVIGRVNWNEVVKKGVAEPNARLRLELVEHGRNWVHTTVLDDATGKPVPCRIHFRSESGVAYQPHGYHNHVNSNFDSWHQDIGGDCRLGQITYAYIDGKCQGWLPRGAVIVDIARGFEYEPLRERIELKPGQRELTFRLRRVRDLNAEGWYSGDTHVHFLSAQGAHNEAAGEDLDVVNVLQSQWGSLFTDTQEWTGRPSVSPDGGSIVYVSQENRQHVLGHLILLGLKEPVMPWCTDGPSESEQGTNCETSVSRWADACRAQGGTVVIPHMPNPNCEPAALIATGRADAVEMINQSDQGTNEYYRYLNCGYKLPLTGGTDKMSSEVPVGLYRTYVFIGTDRPFTYDNWTAALRAGRTFLSAGPLLGFTVEGQAIGDTMKLPGNGGTVEVHAVADSVLPFANLQIVMNGEVVAEAKPAPGEHRVELRAKLRVERHSWLAARCRAPGWGDPKHHDCWGRGVMAHTSPIYLAVGGDWWMFDAETAKYLLTLIHGGLDYVRQRATQWPEGTVTHHHPQPDHQAFLEEPFHQAIESIHQRMHRMGIPH
jgi:hypothetical protein